MITNQGFILCKDFLDPSCAAPIETILRKFHSAWLFKNQSLYDQGAINSAYITKGNFLSSSERSQSRRARVYGLSRDIQFLVKSEY